ncbi:hypothetical protein B7463_g12299, partial [Scytalidium lignicola]
MPLTAVQLRELWQKAISFPDQLTEDEKQELRGEPSILIKNANILKISGLTPSKFMAKAARDPEALTDAESQLIVDRFYIYSSGNERWDANTLARERSEEDRALWSRARKVIHNPERAEIFRNIGLIVSRKSREKNLAHQAEFRVADFNKGPKWIEKVIGLDSWGFVAFRGASITRSNQEWDRYLSYAQLPCASGFVLIQGCGMINRTKRYDWAEEVIDNTDHLALLQNFLNLEEWVWAYDVNFEPDLSAFTSSSEEEYQGRLRVDLRCLFTWFYAVRATEKYPMKKLWEMAQVQRGKRWYVEAQGGSYHSQLVLLEPGTTRGRYTAEL